MADLSPCEPLTPTNAAPVGQDQPTRPRSSEEPRARSGMSGRALGSDRRQAALAHCAAEPDVVRSGLGGGAPVDQAGEHAQGC